MTSRVDAELVPLEIVRRKRIPGEILEPRFGRSDDPIRQARAVHRQEHAHQDCTRRGNKISPGFIGHCITHVCPEFSFWAPGSEPLYTDAASERPHFFIPRCSAPIPVSWGRARRETDWSPCVQGISQTPLHTCAPCHRRAGFVALQAASQPAGTGSAQILRSMSPNSRRVRCPSASRSQ